jgi:hypothetical protein
MTYFITPQYMRALSCEWVMVLAVCLRLVFALRGGLFAERFARATATLVLFIAAGCLIATWPKEPEEILSRMLAHDLPGWIAKLLLLVGAMGALRATRVSEQPQLFLATALGCFLVSANDVVTGALALEGLLLGALATARARVSSGLFLMALGGIYVKLAVTDLGALHAARISTPRDLLIALPPLFAALAGVAYLTRAQGRYAWIVLVSISAFVTRYIAVVFAGTEIARRLTFLS